MARDFHLWLFVPPNKYIHLHDLLSPSRLLVANLSIDYNYRDLDIVSGFIGGLVEILCYVAHSNAVFICGCVTGRDVTWAWDCCPWWQLAVVVQVKCSVWEGVPSYWGSSAAVKHPRLCLTAWPWMCERVYRWTGRTVPQDILRHRKEGRGSNPAQYCYCYYCFV